MIIYGVALLAACMVAGTFVGDYLGVLLGVKANVGGVGIAMLLLVAASTSTRLRGLVEGASGDGIKFWGAMYNPSRRGDGCAAERGGRGAWRHPGGGGRRHRHGGLLRAGAGAQPAERARPAGKETDADAAKGVR